MSHPLKTTIFILTLLITVTCGSAQQKNTATRPSEEVIKQRLVELALKSPKYKASEHLNKINEYQLKRARSTWLNSLSVAYNVNDQTFRQSATPTTNIYPRYTFGVNVPLGIILSHAEAKAAQEQVKMGIQNQEELARVIKRDVLTKYCQYKTTEALLMNQTRILDDVSATFLQAEKMFRENVAGMTVEQYNAAARAKSAEQILLLQLQEQQQILKLDLEEMIGIPLESVLR